MNRLPSRSCQTVAALAFPQLSPKCFQLLAADESGKHLRNGHFAETDARVHVFGVGQTVSLHYFLHAIGAEQVSRLQPESLRFTFQKLFAPDETFLPVHFLKIASNFATRFGRLD